MKPDLAKTVGKKIKLLREGSNISQEELAERAGIHVTNLSKLENGVWSPRIETLYRICKGLGVSVSQVLPPEKPQALDATTEEILSLLVNKTAEEKRIMLGLLKGYRRQKS